MYIKVSTLLVTLAVALVGIFLPTNSTDVRVGLAGLAVASLVLAIFVEIQTDREGRFVKRALERLIQSTTPSSVFAEAVQGVALEAASGRGLPTALVQTLSKQNGHGYEVKLLFTDPSGHAIDGIYFFDHEKLAEWALLEPDELRNAVIDDMFARGPVLDGDVRAHWKNVAEYLRTIAGTLYPTDGPGPGSIQWANSDRLELGVLYPPGVSNQSVARTEVKQFEGAPVRVLTFGQQDLGGLAGKSHIAASKSIAGWLAQAWGMPTVLE